MRHSKHMCKKYFDNRGRKCFPYHLITILFSMYNTPDLSNMEVPKFVIWEIQPLIEPKKLERDKEFYLVRNVVSILG